MQAVGPEAGTPAGMVTHPRGPCPSRSGTSWPPCRHQELRDHTGHVPRGRRTRLVPGARGRGLARPPSAPMQGPGTFKGLGLECVDSRRLSSEMITEYRTHVLVPQSSPKDAFARHGAKFGDAADECVRPKVWGDRPWEAGCSGRGPSISAAAFRRRVRLGSRRNDSGPSLCFGKRSSGNR